MKTYLNLTNLLFYLKFKTIHLNQYDNNCLYKFNLYTLLSII